MPFWLRKFTEQIKNSIFVQNKKRMKRFLGILCCAFAFSACDDGDLVVDTINFDEIATSTCTENNLLFKLKDGESLILNVPEDTFKDDATVENTPTKLLINSVNQVVYNFYDGKVTAEKICAIVPPALPNTLSQWKASSGVIEITTEAVKKVDDANKSTRITGYKNFIVFTDITFTKKDGTTQFYHEFVFGDYLKSITPLALAFNQKLFICDNSNLVFEFNSSESLTLNIDKENLIKNEATLPDKPRTGKIGPVINKLVYRGYENGVLNEDYFCKAPTPLLPSVKEEWLGEAGGDIEVTTTTIGNGFKHTIILKNVSLKKGNSNFQLGNSYKYGDLETVK